MGLKILCSGHLVRYPLGGFCWHHLQYLVGLRRLGHEVTYLEHYGWERSCYDPAHNEMTADPGYGISFLRDLLRPHCLAECWCYLAEEGASHGMPREQLAAACRDCDLYINLSNINWIPELELCRRRVLVDTDPVFTQIRAHGLGGPFERYHALFTYAENVHQPGCSMPTAGARWLPTRQPVVLDLWPVSPGPADGPFSTIMNWSAYGEHEHEGRRFGQKDREFDAYVGLPRRTSATMELAINGPAEVRSRLRDAGWRLADPIVATRTPKSYQAYIAASCAEFSVAKHAYVCTGSGWCSDRSCGYLASGRPVLLQDTGYSRVLPCGAGLLPFRTPDEALAAIMRVTADYASHCRAARQVAETCFDARRVLTELLTHSL